MNKGTMYALGAYIAWGLLPVYWKALHTVPPLETTAHRVVWSFVLIAAVLTYQQRWLTLFAALASRRTLLTFLSTAALLFVNWQIYIYAINAGQIVETSLGYFMNPLVNVLLGVMFLQERMRSWQWVSVAIAAAGVVYMTTAFGVLPWIALGLAVSFGLYGLLRKQATLNSLDGLAVEMGFLAVPMLTYILYLATAGRGALGHSTMPVNILLVLSGVTTALPLLLFAAGARRVPLSLLGLLQYTAPSMQFVIGVYLYHEPFSIHQLIGFSFIWAALILYSVEGVVARRQALNAAR